MRLPDELSFAGLIELAERTGKRHVAETLQNIFDLHLLDEEAAENDYGLPGALDRDETISAELIETLVDRIGEQLSDRAPEVDDGESDLEEEVGDDPYAVSTQTLWDARDFLETVLREFD